MLVSVFQLNTNKSCFVSQFEWWDDPWKSKVSQIDFVSWIQDKYDRTIWVRHFEVKDIPCLNLDMYNLYAFMFNIKISKIGPGKESSIVCIFHCRLWKLFFFQSCYPYPGVDNICEILPILASAYLWDQSLPYPGNISDLFLVHFFVIQPHPTHIFNVVIRIKGVIFVIFNAQH